MLIPNFLKKFGDESKENHQWVKALPMIVKQLTTKWKLTLFPPYLEHVSCSYVANCLVDGKTEAVLKIGFPHEEALHEIEGLQLLNGNPTVKLLNYDKNVNAMLLEKCVSGIHLSTLPEAQQDVIICGLLQQIWRTDYDRADFRPLAEMVTQWNSETYQQLQSFPDPNLAKAGCSLKEELIDSTPKQVLLITDLHAGNVLQAQRKNWLIIDIKPYVGDPAYDLTQHALNCLNRLSQTPKKTINQLAKLAEIEPIRLQQWLFARLASECGGIHQHLALKFKL